MITETGRVIGVEGDWAWVACKRQVACARCAEGRGCGGRLHEVRVAKGSVTVARGDRVLIGLGEDAVMRAAAAVYLLPLVTALGGGVAASALGGGGELPAILGAAAGLVAGLAWARGYSRRHADGSALQPVIRRRNEEAGCART